MSDNAGDRLSGRDARAHPMTGGGDASSVTAPALTHQAFAARLRARESLVGYWITLDSPVVIERIGLARLSGVKMVTTIGRCPGG